MISNNFWIRRGTIFPYLTLFSLLSLSYFPSGSIGTRHPASKYSRYLDACNNTYLLERSQDDDEHTYWYRWPFNESLYDPEDIRVPSPGCRLVPEGFKFKNLLATHTAAWQWYKFPYKDINSSAKCMDAFDDFFSKPWSELCDFPFRLWQRHATEEPLYAWQARHPCRSECQEALESGLCKVDESCSAEDINFNATSSGERKIVQLKTLVANMRDKIVFTCRTQFADFEDPGKGCKENPLAGRERYLDAFLMETVSSPPHDTFSERRCTRCTELWLSRLAYNLTYISDRNQRKYPRPEIQLSRLWVAAVRCRSREFLDEMWQGMVKQHNLPLDWQDYKLEDRADLIVDGPLPANYPLKELYHGISEGDGERIGMSTYDWILQEITICYPFLSQNEIDYYVAQNIFLKIAYCELNCPFGLVRQLEAVGGELGYLKPGFAWYRDKRYLGPPPDHRLGPLFVDMWNRIKDYQKLCGRTRSVFEDLFSDFSARSKPEFGRHGYVTEYRGWYANGKGVSLLSQYVGDTINAVRGLLEADPDMALRVYEKEQDFHATGYIGWRFNVMRKPPPYDRTSAKKAYVCHPEVEAAVRFAVQKDKDASRWWWQLYRTAYGRHKDQYMDFVKTILGTAKDYFEYCELENNEQLLQAVGFLPTEEMSFKRLQRDKVGWAMQFKEDIEGLSERIRVSDEDLEIRIEWLRDGIPNDEITRYLSLSRKESKERG